MAKIGPPEKEIEWKVLDSILQYGANLVDCAEMIGVSEDTIQRRIKALHDCTFSEYRQKKMGRMRMKLLQKQYEMAIGGSVPLLIWMGKQHLGQADKQEHGVSKEAGDMIRLAYRLPDNA